MSETIERPQTEKLVRPARQWQNWWLVAQTHFGNGKFRDPGETFAGRDLHPTKEIAEQRALDCMANNLRRVGACSCKYLGAFPVTP